MNIRSNISQNYLPNQPKPGNQFMGRFGKIANIRVWKWQKRVYIVL